MLFAHKFYQRRTERPEQEEKKAWGKNRDFPSPERSSPHRIHPAKPIEPDGLPDGDGGR
jgi:hypothetical protein